MTFWGRAQGKTNQNVRHVNKINLNLAYTHYHKSHFILIHIRPNEH